MKTLRRVVLPALSFLLSFVAAHAQLVRLSYTGVASWGNPGANWFAPGELVLGETPVWIDITYSPALPPEPATPDPVRIYHPENDPLGRFSDYTYRVRLGLLDITRTITVLSVGDDGSFAVEAFGEGYELSIQNLFTPTGPGNPLPVLPPVDIESWDAGIVFFSHLPHDPPVDYGVLIVDLQSVVLTRLTAVPEPATYGWFGAAVVGGIILTRRRAERAAVLRARL